MSGLLQQLLGDNSGERMLRDALQMSQSKQAAADRKEAREQSAALRVYEKQQKVVTKMQERNLALVSDPVKVDKLVTQRYLPLSPSLMKPKDATKYFNQTDMLDASIPEDHPQKGRVSAVKELFLERLASEEGSARPAADILKDIMEGEARAVREDAYRYKREADATHGLAARIPFFFEGEDSSVRKLAGYDQWLEQQRATENTRFWHELPEDVAKTAALSTAVGAVAGATVGALGGGLPAAGALATVGAAAGTAVMPVVGTAVGATIGAITGLLAGPATGALAGAAVGVSSSLIFDAAAIPAAKILEASEWYNANMGGTKIDRAQAVAAQFGIGLAGGIASTRIASALKGAKSVQDTISPYGRVEDMYKDYAPSSGRLGASPYAPGQSENLPALYKASKATRAEDTLHAMSGETIYQGVAGTDLVPSYGGKTFKRSMLPYEGKGGETIYGGFAPRQKTLPLPQKLITEYIEPAAKSPHWTKPASVIELGSVSTGTVVKGTNPIRLGVGPGKDFKLPKMQRPPEVVEISGMITQSAGRSGAHPSGSIFKDYSIFAREIHNTPESFVFGQTAAEKVYLTAKPMQGSMPKAIQQRIFDSSTKAEQEQIIKLALNKEFVKKYPMVDPMSAAIKDVKQSGILKSQIALEELKYQKVYDTVHNTIKDINTSGNTTATAVKEGNQIAMNIKIRKLENTPGTRAWKDKIKEQIIAGKKVPRIHKLRATMEDLDILKVTEMQAAGKLTVRQADLLASGGQGLSKIKAKEAERILKKFGYDPTKIMSISTLAVGSTLLAPELFGDQAEAGILTNLTTTIPKLFAGAAKKAGTEAGKVAYLNDMKKIGQVVVENSNPRLMPTQMMQQFDVAKYATEAYGSVLKAAVDITGKTRSILGKPMSPGFYGDLLTKAKGHVAVQLASLEASVAGNSGAAMKVYNAIAERVPGIKGNSATVIKEMEELSVRYADDVAPYAEVLKQIQVKEMGNKALKDILGVRGQKIARDAIRAEMEKGDAEYARLLGIKEKLAPNFKKWNAEVDAKHRDLAGRFSGSRIALAAEVDSKFTGREWLKDMLSKEEIEAVEHIKAMKSHYGQRIKADGHQTIDSKPYVHHPLHPAFAEQKVVAQKLREAGLMPGEGTPLTKFFTRAKVSKQLVPDIDYVMQKYIPDAEKRIAYSRFWNGTKDAEGNVINEGWKAYSSQVKHLPGHKEFWQGIEKAMTPAEAIPLYQWANRYYQYEVINMIGGSVSAALKHLFKLEGTIANFGIRETLRHFPEANKQAARLAREYLAGTKWGARAGFTVKQNKTATDELVDSFLSISRHRQTFAEMELDAGISQVNKSARYAKLDKMLQGFADAGSFPIKYVEWIDRAHSVLAIRDLALSQSKFAAKKGMHGPKKGLTAFDASYQTWDTMIKMNFMGGSLNPAWQRNPAVRTLFMFQNTPAKLLERRLVNALKSKDALVKFKDVAFKGYDKQYQALNELQGAMRYIKAAEKTFKAGVYQDAIEVMNSVQTATGQAYYKQFIMDVLISGGIIYGGGQLFDADLKSHVFHFPFLKAHSQEPTVSLAPIVTGAYKTLEGQGEDPDDMFITRFVQNWQGKKGFAPQTFNKLYRISEKDHPKIYKGSWLKHLFSIPARKEH